MNIILLICQYIDSFFNGNAITVNENTVIVAPKASVITKAKNIKTLPKLTPLEAAGTTPPETPQQLQDFQVIQNAINSLMNPITPATPGNFASVDVAENAIFNMVLKTVSVESTFVYQDFVYPNLINCLSVQCQVNIMLYLWTGTDDCATLLPTFIKENSGADIAPDDALHNVLDKWALAAFTYFANVPGFKGAAPPSPACYWLNGLGEPGSEGYINASQVYGWKNQNSIFVGWQAVSDACYAIHKADIAKILDVCAAVVGLIASAFTLGASLGLLGLATAGEVATLTGIAKGLIMVGENANNK